MNSRRFVAVLVFLLAFSAFGAAPESRFAPPVKEPWRAVKRAAGRTDWQTVTVHSNKVTGRLLIHTNYYVELGSGINVRDDAGQFVPADTSFQIAPTGAETIRTAHRVSVPGDIWSGQGVKVTRRNGQDLLFQPLGVGYRSPVDGTRLVLYPLTNTVGWLVGSNEVVWSNCFIGIRASIRIRNFAWGMESDLILHEQPIDPSALNLSAESRLEMFTELVGGDSPSLRPKFIHHERDPARLATMVEPHFIDSELQFNGGTRMVMGRAFGTGNRTNKSTRLSTPVGKSFEIIDQRRIISEAVEHRRARPALIQLPPGTNTFGITNAGLNTFSNANIARLSGHLPAPPRVATANRSEKSIQTASIGKTNPLNATDVNRPVLTAARLSAEPGFVVDFQLVDAEGDGEVDFRFSGDTNWLISSYVSLAGVTTLSGGAILKFSQASGLMIQPGGTVICDNTNWLPTICTTMDDHSVGEQIYGDPGGGWPLDVVAFHFDSGNHELRNLRFSHITDPIWCDFDATITARNIQAIDVFTPFFLMGTSTLNVFNLLARDFSFLYGGDAIAFRGEHITAHNGFEWASLWSPGNSSAVFKNSLMVAIENMSDLGAYSPEPNTVTLASDAGVFQSVEGGEHYLSANSEHRNVGTLDLDPELKNSLAEMTTVAPALLPGNPASDLTLTRLPIRDSDIPDRGYHYPAAIDYLAKDLTLQNRNILLTNGVMIATAPPQNWASIWLAPGRLISRGEATRLNRIVRVNQIHENVQSRIPAMITTGYEDEFKPEMVLRFTDVSSLAGEQYLFTASAEFSRVELSHSALFNGWFSLSMYGGIYQTVGITNTCFQSVGTTFSCPSPAYLFLFNNLFKDGSATFYGANAGWAIQNNVFDHATLEDDGGPIVGFYNAFVGIAQAPSIDDGGPMFTSLPYVPGPLGKYYLDATVLRNQGNPSGAGAFGLAHFTTQRDQAKDTLNCDIGLHYVALDPDGKPLDFDQDGLADYFENATGTGSYGSGDLSNFQNPDSDGDGLPDGFEFSTTLTGLRLADTGNTGTTDAYKDSDGDGFLNQEEFQSGKNPLVPDVATPLFNPLGGTYASAQTVTITCPTAGSSIYYTLDGSEPTISSALYSSPVNVPVNTTLKAKAFKVDWTPSDTESEGYQAAANAAPTVSVLPGNGLTFGASDSIELLVQSEDTDGTVAKLQLYRGDLKVAEAVPGPLRFTLRNVPAGTYAFTARAIDNVGAVTVSPAVSITINSPGPSVSLVGAQPFFTSSPGALLATITGINPGTLSSLTLNGTPVPPAVGSFPLFPVLNEGENTFTLVANGAVSATTKVYLDSAVPTIGITSPANNSSFGTERINVTGTFTEASLKRIIVNGVPAFTDSASGTFEARNVFLPEGANTITAIIEDIAGNTNAATITANGSATPSNPVELTVTPVAGFVSLNTTFTVAANVPGTLLNVHYDFNGDGITDQTAANLNSINHTYGAAGQFFPIVTLQTTAGRFSSLGGWNASPALRINVQEPPVVLNGNGISIPDPVDLKVGGPSSHLFALSRSGEIVKEYDSSETFVRSITLPSGSVPTGLDVDTLGNVYVALSGHHQVAKYKYNLVSGLYEPDPSFNGTGLIGKTDQSSGTGNGQFNTPYDVAVTPDGEQIAVSDSGNHRIQRFTKNGTFIVATGEQGNGLGQFDMPKGLTFDYAGYLWILDSGNNRVAFASSSGVLGISGTAGSALGQFQGAMNIAVDNRGIYVADTGNNRIQYFDPLGSARERAQTPFISRGVVSTQFIPPLSAPASVAVIKNFTDEKLYIADTANGRVVQMRFPTEGPQVVWDNMRQQLGLGNVDNALAHFSSATVERYRKTFLMIGINSVASVPLPPITAAVIDSESAQFWFDQVADSATITFPVEFIKENGIWKILEY